MKLKLKSQLVISIALITTLIMLISMVLAYRGAKAIYQDSNKQSTIREFRQAEFVFNNMMDEVESFSNSIYFDADVQEYIGTSEREDYRSVELQRSILEKFATIRAKNSYVRGIFIIKNNGEIVADNGNDYLASYDRSYTSRFFDSKVYDEIKNLDFQTKWLGNVTDEILGLRTYGDEDHYFVEAKRLRTTSTFLISASLIVCIEEERIGGFYQYLSDYKKNKITMIDGDGSIVSATDKKEIGTQLFVPLENFAGDDGSFEYKIAGERMQLVYHRLKNTGWILVNRIPVDEYIQDILKLQKAFVWVFLAGVILAIIVSEMMMRRVTKPLKAIANALREVEYGNLGNTISYLPQNELGTLVMRYNRMSLSVEKLMSQVHEEERKKRHYEFIALQNQINPHFLFNTLNVIKWMAKSKRAPEIEQALATLGSILEPLYRIKDPMCSLQEEIDSLNHYIAIMNLRFGNGISLMYDIEDKFLEFSILRFILQPFVENSILHGFESTGYAGAIRIALERKESRLLLSVTNSGNPIESDKLKQLKEILMTRNEANTRDSGIGMVNVLQRLIVHYGEESGLTIENMPNGQGVKVTLILPFSPSQSEM